MRAGKKGEIEMNERTVALLREVRRSFFLVLFLVLVLSSNLFAGTFMFFPATGQTICYDAAGNTITCPPADDPVEQAIKYSGDPLPYTDYGNGTVTDNATGLMWQKDENPSSYNWYQAAGKYNGTYNPSSSDVCGSLVIDSYSDWRLPTKKELMTIVDHAAASGPTINSSYFPNAAASLYWSSTTSARYRDNAWAVDFLAGDAVSGDKGSFNGSDGLHVRCVRGNQVHLRAYADTTPKRK
jgi:hypothetical protein